MQRFELIGLLGSLVLITGCQSQSSSDNPNSVAGKSDSSTIAVPTAEEVEQFLIESHAVFNKDSSGDINTVHLEGSAVKDKDLAQLKALKGLRWLYLDPSTSDAGLEHIKELKWLERLYLEGAEVSDSGVQLLASLDELTHLDLTKTRITDKGMKSIGQLSRLKMLKVSDTAVTNRGLEHLEGLERLIVLEAFDTDVSVEGGIELKKSLPSLSVRR